MQGCLLLGVVNANHISLAGVQQGTAELDMTSLHYHQYQCRPRRPATHTPTHPRTCIPPTTHPHLNPTRSYKWDTLPSDKRPERGLLGLRAGLNAFANLRPAIVPKQVGGRDIRGPHSGLLL